MKMVMCLPSSVRMMFEVPELKKRVLFTLFVIFIYRLGSNIIIPGIDPKVSKILNSVVSANTINSVFDTFSGRGISNASILCFSSITLITASSLWAILSLFGIKLEKIKEKNGYIKKNISNITNLLIIIIYSIAYILFLIEKLPDDAMVYRKSGLSDQVFIFYSILLIICCNSLVSGSNQKIFN